MDLQTVVIPQYLGSHLVVINDHTGGVEGIISNQPELKERDLLRLIRDCYDCPHQQPKGLSLDSSNYLHFSVVVQPEGEEEYVDYFTCYPTKIYAE